MSSSVDNPALYFHISSAHISRHVDACVTVLFLIEVWGLCCSHSLSYILKAANWRDSPPTALRVACGFMKACIMSVKVTAKKKNHRDVACSTVQNKPCAVSFHSSWLKDTLSHCFWSLTKALALFVHLAMERHWWFCKSSEWSTSQTLSTTRCLQRQCEQVVDCVLLLKAQQLMWLRDENRWEQK